MRDLLAALALGWHERRIPDNPYLARTLRNAYIIGTIPGWRHWEVWGYEGPRERHPLIARLSRH